MDLNGLYVPLYICESLLMSKNFAPEVQRPAQPWSWHLVRHWHFGSERWRTCLEDSPGPTYCSWVFVVPREIWLKETHIANKSLLAALTWHFLVQVCRSSMDWNRHCDPRGESCKEYQREHLHVEKFKGVLPKRVESAIESRPPRSLWPALFDKHAKHFNTFQHVSTAIRLFVLLLILLDLRLPPIHSNTDEAFVLKLVLSHNDWKICRVCYNHYQSLSPLGWCPSQAA